jgi:hypothetical protein
MTLLERTTVTFPFPNDSEHSFTLRLLIQRGGFWTDEITSKVFGPWGQVKSVSVEEA